MSGSETTPRKQSRLEWSFKKGAYECAEKEATQDAEEGADSGSEKLAACTPSPYKKLKSMSSPEKYKAFLEDLEVTRLHRIAEAEDRCY